ncbi:hypothetical protein JCGZ_05521 [Jatropha curcas]|uniref:Transmembrane protein n=1 Tax=Jatropha curcas TaxID=180498 RepID=A0A067LII5_JATCU|nr:uncharacterized protein LOC105628094 [Jatropha curcas]KDP44054.1 hypothetical protein JCGZ_05521 [Jatropha curcas]
MTSKTFFFLFSILVLVFASQAQDRAPHGLAYENPVAFSPSAVEFFHPKTQPNTKNPCTESSSSACSPLPLAAQVEASDASTTAKSDGNSRLGAGGIAGIVVGLAFAVLLAMVGFYIFVARRNNMKNRDSSVISDV